MEPINNDENSNSKKGKINFRDGIIVLAVLIPAAIICMFLNDEDFINEKMQSLFNSYITDVMDEYDSSITISNPIFDSNTTDLINNSIISNSTTTNLINSNSTISNSSINTSINSSMQKMYFEGCSLEYDSSTWKRDSLKTTDGVSQDGLVYKDNEILFIQLGISELDSAENSYNIDFNTDAGKKKIYDEFYSYWNTSFNLTGGSGKFDRLSGNTYYATMNYGNSSKDAGGKGKLYLIVNKEDNNVIISWLSKYGNDLYGSDNLVYQLIKTINIDRVYNNDLSETLDNLSAWSVYSGNITRNKGLKKEVTGGWRVLANDDSYLEINNNEFYWYKTYEDLNDNYQHGKVSVIQGKSGLKNAGIDESKVDKIIADSAGKLSENDIYTLIMTPTEIISDGISGDISNYREMKKVWILVDHGNDGIEAQVADTYNGTASYYIKVKD